MTTSSFAISNIDNLIVNSKIEKQIVNDTIKTSGDIFNTLYEASINLVEEVNEKQHASNQAQMDFLTGKTDNVLGVIMAQESALSSLNFTVQVTNRMVEVYKQIMQIQV